MWLVWLGKERERGYTLVIFRRKAAQCPQRINQDFRFPRTDICRS